VYDHIIERKKDQKACRNKSILGMPKFDFGVDFLASISRWKFDFRDDKNLVKVDKKVTLVLRGHHL